MLFTGFQADVFIYLKTFESCGQLSKLTQQLPCTRWSLPSSELSLVSAFLSYHMYDANNVLFFWHFEDFLLCIEHSQMRQLSCFYFEALMQVTLLCQGGMLLTRLQTGHLYLYFFWAILGLIIEAAQYYAASLFHFCPAFNTFSEFEFVWLIFKRLLQYFRDFCTIIIQNWGCTMMCSRYYLCFHELSLIWTSSHQST